VSTNSYSLRCARPFFTHTSAQLKAGQGKKSQVCEPCSEKLWQFRPFKVQPSKLNVSELFDKPTNLFCRDFFREVESKYIPTLKAGWSLWVPAHVLNFALVPTKHRILYANVVSIGGCFLLSRAAAGDFSKNKQPAQQMERYSGDMEAMMDINVKLD
jgi:hypothetical protein